MAERTRRPAMKRRGPGIDAAFRSRQARPFSAAPKQKRREWTLREDRLLERHYGSMSVQELQHRLLKGRTLSAIRTRAKNLGLSRPTLHRSWTPRERALVRREYSCPGGLKRLRQALGRTDSMIASEARRMGLYRQADNGWTAEEDAVLFRLYTTHGANTPVRGRSKEAIRIRAEKLGLRVNPRWSAAEDTILRRHRHLGTKDLVSLLPGRTAVAIQGHREYIGLTYMPRPGQPNLRDRWSPQELKVIHQHLWSSTAVFAHLLPGRSRNAINLVRLRIRRHGEE